MPCLVQTDSSEVTQSEIQAVEIALRAIDKTNLARQILGAAANWALVLRMFRDVEIGYLAQPDRALLEDKYRALLASLMGVGELIMVTAKECTGLDLAGTGITMKDLECNVRYLREKYEQWFVPVVDDAAEAALQRAMDEAAANC